MDKLEEIVAKRKVRLAEAKKKRPLAELEKLAKRPLRAPDFLKAVQKPGEIALITEMKRKSPSAGDIKRNFDPAALAAAYEKGGASALSVLTEADFFGGGLEDIEKVRAVSKLPVLCKDFIFDPYQILEAKAAGASAVLLIADMLAPAELNELAAFARENWIEPLVEAFGPSAMRAAIDSGTKLIGINTRNLRTLEMRPERVAELEKKIPADRVIVAESGIKTPADMRALKSLRVSAALVGESLLKNADAAGATRALVEAGKS